MNKFSQLKDYQLNDYKQNFIPKENLPPSRPEHHLTKPSLYKEKLIYQLNHFQPKNLPQTPGLPQQSKKEHLDESDSKFKKYEMISCL